MAAHTGRFEKTPFRNQRDTLLQMLVEQFWWTLAPIV